MKMDGVNPKNNMFSKHQRVITDNYRDGYDEADWSEKPKGLKEERTAINRVRITFNK